MDKIKDTIQYYEDGLLTKRETLNKILDEVLSQLKGE